MKRRKAARWVAAIVLFALLSLVLVGNLNLYRVYRRTRNLRGRVEALNRTIDSLNVEIENLKSDTAYIEKIARERLGMARKDEKIYKFIEENK